jgi:ribokinase
MQIDPAAPILVSGLINIETTLKVPGFPLEYAPVHYPFFGVGSAVSGVGFNLAKALTTLGHPVRLLSLLGRDFAGDQARAALEEAGISPGDVLRPLAHTAQSVILYDPAGRRQIHVDLKDIQERQYPAEAFLQAAQGCALAVLCNINFSRPLLAPARRLGLPVATDVHTLADLDDPYNADFLAAADILFMSDERLPESPEAWARRVMSRTPCRILGIGLGGQGALLAVRADDFVGRIPAAAARPVVNTIGAGDALFSAFLHEYLRSADPYRAMRKAVLFAGYKIGAAGAADGFLDAAALDRLDREIHPGG